MIDGIERRKLHTLVDDVWSYAKESTEVPSTQTADQLIDAWVFRDVPNADQPDINIESQVHLSKVLSGDEWLFERAGTYFRLTRDDVKQIAALAGIKHE